jgi:DME family drug/metabolite transporter
MTAARPRRTVAGSTYVASAAVLFGFLGIFAGMAYEHGASVATVVAVRSLAGAVATPLLLRRSRRAELLRAPRQLVAMSALVVVNVATYFVAVSRMSPALVAIVVYAYPAVALMGEWALRWVALNRVTVLALAMSLPGIALVVSAPSSGVDAVAVALAAANAAGYAAYLLVARSSVEYVDPLTSVAGMEGISGAVLLAAAVAIGPIEVPDEGFGLLGLAGVAIVSTPLVHVLHFRGIDRLQSAGAAALIATLELVAVVAASVIVLGDSLRPVTAAGAALVLCGAVVAPMAVTPAKRTPRTRKDAV